MVVFLIFPIAVHAESACICNFKIEDKLDLYDNEYCLYDIHEVGPARDNVFCTNYCKNAIKDAGDPDRFTATLINGWYLTDTRVGQTNLNICEKAKFEPEVVAVGGLTPSREFAIPTLGVDLDFTFSKPIEKSGTGKLRIDFIGEYMSAVYRWLLGASVTFAIVLIMIGGVQYVLSAGSGDVSAAKERITNAVIGFVLLLGTYAILYTVNPELTLLTGLELPMVDPREYVAVSGDTAGAANKEKLARLGIICDSQTNVLTVATSFVGKTAYRMGGKGGDPPFEYETKISPSGTPYRDFCPPDNICLDCSGYVHLVASCAGLTPVAPDKGTRGIFMNAPEVDSCSKKSVTLTDGSVQQLKPGDLIGFPGYQTSLGDATDRIGHVWMYLGEDLLINSAGSGREAGKAVFTQSLSVVCSKFLNKPLHVILR